jgi:exodeoxyribonuclease V alpha subunit
MDLGEGSLPNESRRRGSRSLNIEAALNPAGERKVEHFGWTFAPGDKVMEVENDHDREVYTANFDGRAATYGFGELDNAGPGLRRHHPQGPGSEYPAVVIGVLTQHYPSAATKSHLTDITRGSASWFWSARRRRLRFAVRNVSARRRLSKLDEWLRVDAPSKSSSLIECGMKR